MVAASRKRQRTAAADESTHVQEEGGIDDDGKKSRGRPRVEGQDETAADVSYHSLSF
jgi:hypothetical protein